MLRDRYAPLKLNQTNRYVGYQFHARVHVDGMPPSYAFRFLILSVCHWIRSKVPEEDRKVQELSLPEAEEYASVSEDAFLPYHFSIGYALDITPVMESGIWALRLREDEYEGKSISVEPHLKLKFAKGDAAQHQRVHFCYLPELRRIVIGYVGDHLDSAATRYVK